MPFIISGVMMIPTASGANVADAATPSHVENGHKLFEANCAVCHGEDGRGSQVGKSLGAAVLPSAKVQHQSDTMLIHTILDGKGTMPPFKGILDHSKVTDLVLYVRVLGKVNK